MWIERDETVQTSLNGPPRGKWSSLSHDANSAAALAIEPRLYLLPLCFKLTGVFFVSL